MSEQLVPIFRVANAQATARGTVNLHLSEHLGDAPPECVAYFYVDDVDDVDVVAAEFGVAVEEQPWAREIELTDPDRNRLRIGSLPS